MSVLHSCSCIILNLLYSLRKSDKMLSKPRAWYRFTPTRLINSIKYEHSCYTLYFYTEMDDSSDSEVEEKLGIERPSLIEELKSVLSEYPDDGQIIKVCNRQ